MSKEILEEMKLPFLLEEIAKPDFPSPASVSSSAIIAAIASGLIEMSCGCTLDESACSSVHPQVNQAKERCQQLRKELLSLAQQDIDNFAEYLLVNKLEKKGMKETEKMQAVKWEFAFIPLEIAAKSHLLLEKIKDLIPLVYEKVVCDLIIAKRLLTVNIGNLVLVIEENIQTLEAGKKKVIGVRLRELEKKRNQTGISIEELWKIRKSTELIHN